MTTDIQLTKFAKARVSWQPQVNLRFQADGVLSRDVLGQSARSPRFVSIEALVPRGGKADFGLLGISYEPRDAAGLRIEVRYANAHGARWSSSLAATIDEVGIGLPKVYAEAVLDGFSESSQQPPCGVLVLVEAAHGLVGSSPDFFRKIARACMGVLLLAEPPEADEALAAILRGTLVA
jgi:hypothetical protein